MKAQIKAHELINSFISLGVHNFEDAKRCAIGTCNEMLELGTLVNNDLSDIFYIFWSDVKQEILKLDSI